MMRGPAHLRNLNVSNNIIQDIQPGAFTNMSRLVRLIITKNKITKLDPLSLSGMHYICTLEDYPMWVGNWMT